MFEPGDKVEMVEDFVDEPKKGATGTVKGMRPNGRVAIVEFDKPFLGGHNCNGECETGRGYWVPSELLKKIQEADQDVHP